MTKLNYPAPGSVPTEVKNTALKYAYTYIAQELLRLKHNEVGTKFRSGEITEQEWRDFLKNWWQPRQDTVASDLLELRQICKGFSIQYKDNVNLEDIPI